MAPIKNPAIKSRRKIEIDVISSYRYSLKNKIAQHQILIWRVKGLYNKKKRLNIASSEASRTQYVYRGKDRNLPKLCICGGICGGCLSGLGKC